MDRKEVVIKKRNEEEVEVRDGDERTRNNVCRGRMEGTGW